MNKRLFADIDFDQNTNKSSDDHSYEPCAAKNDSL
jgi:hypothetical protein